MLYMVSGINKIVNKQYGKREKRETRFDPVLKGLIGSIRTQEQTDGFFKKILTYIHMTVNV